MTRVLPLIALLAAGCATTAERRLVQVERELAELRAPPAQLSYRLGGPLASEPVASLGTWVPVQAAKQTLLAQARPPAMSAITGVTIGTDQTITGLKTFSGVLTASGGIVQSTGTATLAAVSISNYLVDTGVLYLRGATNYITNDNGTDPVRVLDLEGLCVGDLTGVNCDGTIEAAVLKGQVALNPGVAAGSLGLALGGSDAYLNSNGAGGVIYFRTNVTVRASISSAGFNLVGVATGSLGTCGAGVANNEGTIQYDTSTQTVKWCNGTAWATL